MIKTILIINNFGKPRLTKFYEDLTDEDKKNVIKRVFQQIIKRADSFCNYLEGIGLLPEWKDTKIVYRHYATLYFIFVVDSQESDLGMLDLIQVLVETLDKNFSNVCELDLVYHSDKCHYIMDEVIMGGMVLETNVGAICHAIAEQEKIVANANIPNETGSVEHHTTSTGTASTASSFFSMISGSLLSPTNR